MTNHLGWLKRDAIDSRNQYLNLLYLKKKYFEHNYTLFPTEDIDEFAHLHILDTRKYRSDCYSIYGRFIEHNQYLGIDNKSNLNDLKKYFEFTQNLYYKEFSSYMVHNRSKHPKIIYYLMKKLELN